MATRCPQSIDRRTLVARGAATAALAAALHRPVFAGQASPSPVMISDGIEQLVAGSTSFAFDLFRAIREGASGNVVFSPYSVSLALAMVYAGARGETAEQMANVLGYELPGQDIHTAFSSLTSDMKARGNVDEEEDQGILRIANALWGEASFPFSDSFIQKLDTYYGAGLRLTDFKHEPDGAREEINTWVAEKTADHIQEIVPAGVITELTRLVLVNAVYFSSTWHSAFEVSDTEEETFHVSDGGNIETPFMVQTKDFPYRKADLAQVVELPYASDGYAMTIILPDDGQFAAVENNLDADALAELVAPLDRTKVELHLPKFEFETARNLVEVLEALGMTALFDIDRADLSGMAGDAAEEDLMISDVLHNAFISIDEEGTEAAAATVAMGVTGAAPQEPEEPVLLKVNRPFIFAIRDTDTGTVLFLGRVMNPAGA